MDEMLIVTSSENSRAFLEGFVKEGFSQAVVVAPSGALARRMLKERDFDVVIVNTPLKDENGDELAVNFAEETDSGVVLIIKSEIEEEVGERVQVFGVLTVAKPISRALLAQAIRLAVATHSRVSEYKKRTEALEHKIEEIRTVDKAKYALIQYLGMTESQAHRYIEKQAMDRRVTKKDVAFDILSQYG
jgi:response regulator NasT